MDNDETDAQGRAGRWRTGLSLKKDSGWPYAYSSLWDFNLCFLLYVLEQGRELQLPFQYPHQFSFTLVTVQLSNFCHGSLCLYLGYN